MFLSDTDDRGTTTTIQVSPAKDLVASFVFVIVGLCLTFNSGNRVTWGHFLLELLCGVVLIYIGSCLAWASLRLVWRWMRTYDAVTRGK